MELQDKNVKITLARKRAPDYLAKWQERRKELKQKRINSKVVISTLVLQG
jgi:hypothetical protein